MGDSEESREAAGEFLGIAALEEDETDFAPSLIESVSEVSSAPSGLAHVFIVTHGLRRGLHLAPLCG